MQIKVFGHNECSYCSAATTLLDIMGMAYEYHNVKLSTEAYDLMLTYTPPGWTSVPAIVINEEFIGGYNELTRHFNDS